MKLTLRLLSIAVCTFLMFSCNSHPSKTTSEAAKTDSASVSPKTMPSDKPSQLDSKNKLNDVALYLAGMKPDSFIAIPERLQKLSYYKKYCDSMDLGFKTIEANRLSKMRNWAKTEMAPELASPKTVLYPFSGPDILHCVQFFPDADNYIMMAMEKYGSLPVMEKMDSAKTTHTLNYVRQSLEDIFGKSYFITRKMAVNVSNQYNGVTPLACVFLVRAGYSILDVKYKHLLDDGKTFETIPLDSMNRHLNECVEIYFRKNGGTKIQKLTYFKTNLGDNQFGIVGLKANTGLKTFLENLPEVYTYAKSASYLMSQKDFDQIRSVVLTKSKTILQDDTGVGFGFIDKNKWKITLYGSYTKPISDFHGGYYQPWLEKAYKADSVNVKPLPYSLGYHWRDQVQNLMKFEKK